MKVVALSLLLLGAVSSALAQLDNDCDEADNGGDAFAMAQANWFPTGMDGGPSLEEVAENLSDMPGHVKEMAALNTENSEDLLATSTLDTTSAFVSILPYYKPVCPRRFFYLKKYYWYYSVVNNQERRTRCWSAWPIYAVSCATTHCNLGYNYQWWYYARCVPSYRSVVAYFRCANSVVTADGWTWTWSSWQVRRVWVPRDCCCRRYSKYHLAVDQCAVKGK